MILDVIGVYMNNAISTISASAKVPFVQKRTVTVGSTFVTKMYVVDNNSKVVDITNWEFWMSLGLQQAPNPSIPGPPPLLNIKRQGVIASATAGIVNFTFTYAETELWFPSEEDNYDIYGISPAPGLTHEPLVPTSQLIVEAATTVFPQPAGPAPAPTPEFPLILSYPTGSLPDPRTLPINAMVRDSTLNRFAVNVNGLTWTYVP